MRGVQSGKGVTRADGTVGYSGRDRTLGVGSSTEFDNPQFADVSLNVVSSDGSRRLACFFAHRMVLVQESAFFSSMFQGQFKEALSAQDPCHRPTTSRSSLPQADNSPQAKPSGDEDAWMTAEFGVGRAVPDYCVSRAVELALPAHAPDLQSVGAYPLPLALDLVVLQFFLKLLYQCYKASWSADTRTHAISRIGSVWDQHVSNHPVVAKLAFGGPSAPASLDDSDPPSHLACVVQVQERDVDSKADSNADSKAEGRIPASMQHQMKLRLLAFCEFFGCSELFDGVMLHLISTTQFFQDFVSLFSVAARLKQRVQEMQYIPNSGRTVLDNLWMEFLPPSPVLCNNPIVQRCIATQPPLPSPSSSSASSSSSLSEANKDANKKRRRGTDGERQSEEGVSQPSAKRARTEDATPTNNHKPEQTSEHNNVDPKNVDPKPEQNRQPDPKKVSKDRSEGGCFLQVDYHFVKQLAQMLCKSAELEPLGDNTTACLAKCMWVLDQIGAMLLDDQLSVDRRTKLLIESVPIHMHIGAGLSEEWFGAHVLGRCPQHEMYPMFALFRHITHSCHITDSSWKFAEVTEKLFERLVRQGNTMPNGTVANGTNRTNGTHGADHHEVRHRETMRHLGRFAALSSAPIVRSLPKEYRKTLTQRLVSILTLPLAFRSAVPLHSTYTRRLVVQFPGVNLAASGGRIDAVCFTIFGGHLVEVRLRSASPANDPPTKTACNQQPSEDHKAGHSATTTSSTATVVATGSASFGGDGFVDAGFVDRPASGIHSSVARNSGRGATVGGGGGGRPEEVQARPVTQPEVVSLLLNAPERDEDDPYWDTLNHNSPVNRKKLHRSMFNHVLGQASDGEETEPDSDVDIDIDDVVARDLHSPNPTDRRQTRRWPNAGHGSVNANASAPQRGAGFGRVGVGFVTPPVLRAPPLRAPNRRGDRRGPGPARASGLLGRHDLESLVRLASDEMARVEPIYRAPCQIGTTTGLDKSALKTLELRVYVHETSTFGGTTLQEVLGQFLVPEADAEQRGTMLQALSNPPYSYHTEFFYEVDPTMLSPPWQTPTSSANTTASDSASASANNNGNGSGTAATARSRARTPMRVSEPTILQLAVPEHGTVSLSVPLTLFGTSITARKTYMCNEFLG